MTFLSKIKFKKKHSFSVGIICSLESYRYRIHLRVIYILGQMKKAQAYETIYSLDRIAYIYKMTNNKKKNSQTIKENEELCGDRLVTFTSKTYL